MKMAYTTEGDIFNREEDGSKEIVTRVRAKKPERLSAASLSGGYTNSWERGGRR